MKPAFTPAEKRSPVLASGTRPAASGAQHAVPNRDGEQNGEQADEQKRRNPTLRLLLAAADPDHYARDLIGTLRFGTPEAVLVGVEDKFAFSVGVASDYRGLGTAG